jgi:hypothetical protein
MKAKFVNEAGVVFEDDGGDRGPYVQYQGRLYRGTGLVAGPDDGAQWYEYRPAPPEPGVIPLTRAGQGRRP